MEGEGAAGLGHGPQVDGVGRHLGHGDLGLHHLLAVLSGIHAHDAAAALVQVTDDVAHVAVWNGDLQLADGLHEHGVGLRHGGLVGQLGRGLESDLGGVHGVVASIIEDSLQVDHGVARQRSVNAGFTQALLHSGEIVLGHGAAENLLGKDHLVALRIGLKADPDIAELAGTAGLLFVAALFGDCLADLLTIGHPGGLQLRLHIEAALQLGHQHIHLHVSGAAEDHLVGLAVVHQGEGRVLLVQAGQALGDLVLLPPGLGHDGHGVAGLGEGDGGHEEDLAGVTQGITGLDLLQLADGADIAAGELLDLHGLLAPHGVQPAQLLGGAGAGVDQGQVGGDGAGDDLDEGVLAVLVGDRLEHEGAGYAAGGDGVFLLVAAGEHALAHVALHRVGQKLHDIVHQHQGAHGGHGGAAQHGEEGQLPHALAQALDHLHIGEVLAGEEFVHKLLAGLGHGFLQSVVELGDHVLFALRQLDLHPFAVLHLVGALVEHVDDAGDLLVVVPDGDHDGGDFVAEALTQGVEGGVIVGVFLICLGDIDKAGHVALLAVAPGFFKSHRDAVFGGADDDGGVRDLEGLQHLT